MSQAKVLYHVLTKRQNRRIGITVYQEPDGSCAFLVVTKRLADRKSRHIIETRNLYGVETFIMLEQLFELILADPNICKAINKETKFPKWDASIYNSFKQQH